MEAGEILGVVGESGSGKSVTALTVMLGSVRARLPAPEKDRTVGPDA
ncbi:MAG: hypothetical protein WCO67_24610 [Betaproteobacteria bacterium]